MTGKDALKLAQDTILANNGNNKSSFTMKNLYLVEEELNEKDKKLTKYKRAFEILKRKGLRIVEYDADEYSQYLNFTKGVDTDLEPEEAELLEELMTGEEIR